MELLKNVLIYVAAFLLLTGFSSGGSETSKKDADEAARKELFKDFFITRSSEDKFRTMYTEGMDQGYFYYEELTRKLLPMFAGKPYGSGGAGCPSNKTLVNFNSFDCVTLVETWWALSRTLYLYQSGRIPEHIDPFLVFSKSLNRIRYFGGENCGIEYRIHYFTQQMEELSRSGMAFNVGIANGYPFQKRIDYISKNEEQYGDFASSAKHKSVERILNKTPKYYYPTQHRKMYYPLAKDGDIIAFSSVEPGLDVSHCAIITIEDGKPKLNHASGLYEKVVLGQDLDYYIRNRTKVNGFFVYRPRFES